MRLIIAEKPSLARSIAEALPGAAQKKDGYLSVGDTEVTWCLGHLLEQAPPDAYDPAFKPWRRDHLPIVPGQWKLVPRPKARGQLSVIRARLKQARQLVHAGDPDREGQLLVQEVIEHLGWKGPVQRLSRSGVEQPTALVQAMGLAGDPPGLQGAGADAQVSPQHIEGVGREMTDLLIAAHHQAKHRRLHASHRQHAIVARLAADQGPGAGQVDAVQPVGAGAGLGGAVERVIPGIVLDPPECSSHRRPVEVVDQQALDRALPAQVFDHLLDQQLALFITITSRRV